MHAGLESGAGGFTPAARTFDSAPAAAVAPIAADCAVPGQLPALTCIIRGGHFAEYRKDNRHLLPKSIRSLPSVTRPGSRSTVLIGV